VGAKPANTVMITAEAMMTKKSRLFVSAFSIAMVFMCRSGPLFAAMGGALNRRQSREICLID
jgi:hypothetical protein